MSLHFTVKVSGHSIYHAMDITRLEPDGTPTADTVYRYRAQAVNEDGVTPARQMEAVVEHRYSDGAWELIRKALNAMQCVPPRPHTKTSSPHHPSIR